MKRETGTIVREMKRGSLHLQTSRSLRLIGQIGATYLVAEGPDGLYLVDQHAAHERVLFEKLMLQHDKRNIPSQALLEPVSVTLPPAQATLLEEQLELLNRFGFQVEPLGRIRSRCAPCRPCSQAVTPPLRCARW